MTLCFSAVLNGSTAAVPGKTTPPSRTGQYAVVGGRQIKPFDKPVRRLLCVHVVCLFQKNLRTLFSAPVCEKIQFRAYILNAVPPNQRGLVDISYNLVTSIETRLYRRRVDCKTYKRNSPSGHLKTVFSRFFLVRISPTHKQ